MNLKWISENIGERLVQFAHNWNFGIDRFPIFRPSLPTFHYSIIPCSLPRRTTFNYNLFCRRKPGSLGQVRDNRLCHLSKLYVVSGVRFQVFRRRRIRCQQLKSTRWMGVAHELDFLSPLVTFSLNPIRVQNSGFFFY